MRVAFAPLTALVTVAALAIAPACGFPTLSYEDEGGTSSGGSSGSTGGSSGGMHDAASDGSVTADGSSGGVGDGMSGDALGDSSVSDGAAQDSSTGPPEAGFDSGNPCDVDGDGHLAKNAMCNGDDCCDTDWYAHPMQASWFTTQDACMSFDYNCDNTVEDQYLVDLTCGGTPALGCTPMGEGFTTDVTCGNSGLVSQCEPSGALACKPMGVANETQGCH